MKNWIDKQKYLIDFILSSLMRRKGKNISLFALYTFIIFVLASVIFFTHAIKQEASIILRDAPEMVVQKLTAGRHDLVPADYVEKLRKIRGVRSARERLWGYFFDSSTGANYTLMTPHDNEPRPGTIVIGNGISRTRNAYEGDIISLKNYRGEKASFEIAGVFSSESELVTCDLILISGKDFRDFFGMPEGFFTDITVTAPNPRELVTIATKVTQTLPDTRPILRNEILRTYDSIFDWRGGVLVVVMSFAILAFVIFAWDKASGLSAEERKEIGILKGIGWETSDVILMKFWEGAVISFSAYLSGVILAYIHVFFASSVVFEHVLKGWSVLYPQFGLTPFISPEQLAVLFFLTVAPYTLATIIPTWRAATIDPDSAMREL